MSLALIVDDDPDIVDVVKTTLELEGWQTLDTSNGEHVADLAAVNQPSVILLDMMMPNVDGIEALRELRSDRRTEHIPVIVLSAIGDFEIGTRFDVDIIGSRAGVAPPEGFLEKPVDPKALMALVNDVTA